MTHKLSIKFKLKLKSNIPLKNPFEGRRQNQIKLARSARCPAVFAHERYNHSSGLVDDPVPGIIAYLVDHRCSKIAAAAVQLDDIAHCDMVEKENSSAES